jgi:GGDEF domain-containing protein
MKRIRFRVIILACWLVVFCNLERLLEPLTVSGFTYALALAMVMIALIVPRLVRIPLWAILVAPVPVLLLFKAGMGEFAKSLSIPHAFLEVCILALTTFLAYWVSIAISEFESSVAHISVGRNDKLPESDAVGQGLIYREVRRARNHQRPLTLMTVGVDEKSIKVALDRMVQETQMAMMKQYALSDVSKTLCKTFEDSDIIVKSNDHFLIVLPETRPENVPGLIERLRQQVSEEVGVNLKIGTASLPVDAFTLEGLIDKATDEMQADQGSYRVTEIEQLPMRQKVS